MGDIQYVQWRPADIMQGTTNQRVVYKNSTTTRYYQQKGRIWSRKSMGS